jgi:hypothetical protein
VCPHINGCLQLRDGVVQVAYKNVVEKTRKIIEKMGRLVKLQAKHPPLGQNMIKFELHGPKISSWRTCWKNYGGANASRWNLEVEPLLFDELFKWKKTRTG